MLKIRSEQGLIECGFALKILACNSLKVMVAYDGLMLTELVLDLSFESSESYEQDYSTSTHRSELLHNHINMNKICRSFSPGKGLCAHQGLGCGLRVQLKRATPHILDPGLT